MDSSIQSLRNSMGSDSGYISISTPHSASLGSINSKRSIDVSRHSHGMKLRSQCRWSECSDFAKSKCQKLDLSTEIVQSTPCTVETPKLHSPLKNISLSPISSKRRSTPFSISSKKFSKLAITNHPVTAVTNNGLRRLNKQSVYKGLHGRRSNQQYINKEKIDFIKLLGEKSSYPKIISKILQYLDINDLGHAHMVSKSWNRICRSDPRAEERRLKHLMLKESVKENCTTLSKFKLEEQVQQSSQRRYFTRQSLMTSVYSNTLQLPNNHITPTSPPVSPSKVIFHSFIKASRTLAPRDNLISCPACKFACHIDSAKQIGTCTRQSCSMEEFCILCLSKTHPGEVCKMPLLATPTKNKQQPLIGTKQCKRSLRRISRLNS